jgi:two-component system phosphate regulon sensor histidine kinase PhoR
LQYKINIQFTIITLISIILCTCITAYVFYGALNREVFLDLKLYAEMLASEDLMSDSKLNIPDGIRVTLIDNDGNAIYDSMTDVTALENHNKRPEVIDAFRSGEGQARRRSSTLSNDAYYYAIKLDNGNVLRVAKEGSSLTSLITSIVPMLAVLLILLSIIFIGFSRVMTNNIVRPISQLAVDTANVNEDEIYPELRPFVKKIQSQHEEILKDSNMRQEFTANVSHELKTPLTAISGYAEMIENDIAKGDDVKRFAGKIRTESSRMLTLIGDIIKLSKLDSNVSNEASDMVDLKKTAEECKDSLAVACKEKDIIITITGEAEPIKGNQTEIYELVYNLMDNAVKYNRRGGNVDVVLSGKTIKISDTGIGVPDEDRQRIFERFYRVDKSRSKATGGTGLGLSIVKHVAEKHNAAITVESTLNVGTDITVDFNGAKE